VASARWHRPESARQVPAGIRRGRARAAARGRGASRETRGEASRPTHNAGRAGTYIVSAVGRRGSSLDYDVVVVDAAFALPNHPHRRAPGVRVERALHVVSGVDRYAVDLHDHIAL